MSQQRSISRVVNVPPAAPGFVGPGHLAAPVVSPENFEMNDPFILLMDDHLDIGDRPVGGPHPHAGFETHFPPGRSKTSTYLSLLTSSHSKTSIF